MPDPIRYRLRFPDRAHHYLEVEGRFPAAGRTELELVMAVWTPGSYLVREFAKHVEALCAAAPDGAPLAVVKSAKNRWRVTTSGAAEAVVRYRLYARDLSVRGNFVDAEFALVNGAATFLAPADGPARPFEVCVERPDDWERLVVARHAMRNAMLPQITGLALAIGTMVGGALVAEVIFSYPGLGTTLLTAITGGDYPLISATTLIITLMVLIANFALEILYGFIDPRIKAAQAD